MSEQYPDWCVSEQARDSYRHEQGTNKARERVGEGAVYGTVTVVYDEPAYDTGQVWVKGTCGECEATSVMRSSGNESSLYYLAFSIARYNCAKRGHENRSIRRKEFRNEEDTE